MEHKRKHSRSGVVGGILLICVGLMLFFQQNFQFSVFHLFENWNFPYPAYIIVPGLVLLAFGLFGGRELTGLTIAGSIVIGTGLLLAFQDRTGSYQTWAYLWALIFPGMVGLGLLMHSFVSREQEQRQTGLRLMGIALVLALVGWSFFEGMINLSGYALPHLTNYTGSLLLIGLGVWLLLRRGTFWRR